MIKKKKINTYELRRFIKLILLLFAVLVGILTLFLSQRLVEKIAIEETKKMEVWADAEQILTDPGSEGDLGFHLKIVQSNETIPAILVSETGSIIQHINIVKEGEIISPEKLEDKLVQFESENEPIDIPIDENTIYKVYYGKSSVLRQLEYYPYVVLGIVALFASTPLAPTNAPGPCAAPQGRGQLVQGRGLVYRLGRHPLQQHGEGAQDLHQHRGCLR